MQRANTDEVTLSADPLAGREPPCTRRRGRRLTELAMPAMLFLPIIEVSEIGVELAPTGDVQPKTGSVTVYGTVYCAQPEGILIFGKLTQKFGHFTPTVYYETTVDCDGTTEWMVPDLADEDGLFKSGKAVHSVEAIACDQYTCRYDYAEATIKLTGGK